ncbi:MAG: ABC-type transport auxiliary lipoprotein family protein [Gammaproteobacteria bacterium]
MRRAFGWPAIFAAVCIMAACSLWPAQVPLPQVHDFGPLPAVHDSDAARLSLNPITAPVWLASDAIHYRLLYNDPTALRTYADHRWAAPPAELLAARLQYLLPLRSVGDTRAHSVYALNAALLEFEQDFNTPHDAHVRLVLEVSMQRSSDGQIIAERRFVMTQSISPDVQGAISGLAQLANRTAMAIADWARAQVHE